MCDTLHNCIKVHEDNVRLRRAMKKLRVNEQALSRELSGVREQQKLSEILSSHVNTRNSYAQTDSIEDLNGFDSSRPWYNSASRRAPWLSGRSNNAIDETSRALVRLVKMQNESRNNYERELKRTAEHLQLLAAQDVRLHQFEEELGIARKKISLLEQRNSELDKALSDRSDDTVRQLRRRIEKLRKEKRLLCFELSSLDGTFFEEVEDLKWSLEEARQLIKRYEIYCAGLAHRLGLPGCGTLAEVSEHLMAEHAPNKPHLNG